MDVVKVETKRFFEHTSVKGWPRFIKAETAGLKVIWFFSVLTLLSLCTFSLYNLLSTYTQYDVTVQLDVQAVQGSTGVLDRLIETFPDVTLCNTNPISSRADYSLVPVTPTEFMGMVQQVQYEVGSHNQNSSQLYNDILESFLKEQASPLGYFQFIGKSLANKLGHTEDSFIAKCQVLAYYGSWKTAVSCGTGFATIRQVTIPQYYNCFTVNIAWSEGEGGPLPFGISLILYLDNPEGGDPVNDKAHGNLGSVIISVTERDGLMHGTHQVSLLPGTRTVVSVATHENIKLPHPHGNCKNEDDIRYTYDLDGRPVLGGHWSCLMACWRNATAQQCQCNDVHTPASFDPDNYPDLPYCFSLVNGLDEAMQNLACLGNATQGWFDHCMAECPDACVQLDHRLLTTTSAWPVISEADFYDQYIDGKPYAHKFAKYRRDESGHRSENAADPFFSKLLRDNFLQVDVFLGDTFITTHQEVPSMTATQLLSQFGGTVNLLCGITMLVLVEFLEMLWRIFSGLVHHKKTAITKIDVQPPDRQYQLQ